MGKVIFCIVSEDNHYDIISDKSTIPDLIIYNKLLNKNVCFLQANRNNKFNKDTRVQFLLRPRKNLRTLFTYGDEEVETNKKIEKKIRKRENLSHLNLKVFQKI